MTSNRNFRLLAAVFAGANLLSLAHAQGGGWAFECIDPLNTAPYSDDFFSIGISNDFLRFRMGTSGTVTYGGATGPCYAPAARTLDAAGRFCISVGNIGSVQTSFDNGLAMTVGAPRDPVGDYCYARLIRYTDPTVAADAKSVLFGDGGLQGFFVGASKRYFVGIFSSDGAQATLTARSIGDAVRMNWKLTNTTTGIMYLGLRFGAYVGMRTSNSGKVDVTGANQANSILRGASSIAKPQAAGPDGSLWIGFNTTDTTRPLRTEHNFLATRSNFPSHANFMFGQTDAFGLRIDNQAFAETPDATKADQFIVGNHGTILFGNNMRPRVFTDFGAGDPILDTGASDIQEEADILLSEVSFFQTFKPESVSGGGSRDVNFYLRSPWSVGDYRDPYTTVLDAPRLIANGTGNQNLEPNPFTIVAYVDNQYATVDREVPLSNVRVTITLPENSGLKLVAGESRQKVITSIAPNDIANVRWQVESDGSTVGKVQYSVKVEPNPGPTRTLTGSILVASTPKIRLAAGPNLVTLPWTFSDTALDAILGLQQGVDYLAYRWNSDIGEYVPVTSASRGGSLWIIPLSDKGLVSLNGASAPSDAVLGGSSTTLRPGWNMIGNPYNYPVTLSQIIGVAEDNPSNSLTWQELVDTQLVSSSLVYFSRDPSDPNSGTYKFTEGQADSILPNVGYWLYVSALSPVKLIWPAVFAEELPNSFRSRSSSSTTSKWQQTDKQWRVNLVARNGVGLDAANYIGLANGKKAATTLRMPKAPAPRDSKIELSVLEDVNGKPTRLSQSLAETMTRKEWKVYVRSEVAGDVSVNWPNVSSIPRNVRMQIVDKTANTTRDMRFASGYTFNMSKPGTRELTIQMEPGAALRAVIGDVVVTRPSKDVRAPFAISYALSSQATTTIRILGGAGKEVYTVTRGRADSAGQNTATWAMRDSSNRAVAPGTYQVEIVAETASGERVRKLVPVNVVR